MQDDFLSSFLKTFFSANDCTLEEEEQGVLHVHLTEELDKALMNRPFYWQYMQSTNQTGIPMKLKLITNPEKRHQKGEWIPFGTNRLQQIEHYLKKQAQYTVLFQSIQTEQKVMLQPWLLINYQLIFTGKQRKEFMMSFGLNLINGAMTLNMMERLNEIPLTQTISNQCYTISPLITIQSGFFRIEKYINQHIEQQDHTWAVESIRLLEEELAMLDYFYKGEQNSSKKENEIASLMDRLSPTIHHKVINGGLVYLEKGMFMH